MSSRSPRNRTALADAQRVGQRLEPSPLGAVPDQVELDLGPLLTRRGNGTQQRGVVLGPVQSRHRHDHAAVGRRAWLAAGRRRLGAVDDGHDPARPGQRRRRQLVPRRFAHRHDARARARGDRELQLGAPRAIAPGPAVAGGDAGPHPRQRRRRRADDRGRDVVAVNGVGTLPPQRPGQRPEPVDAPRAGADGRRPRRRRRATAAPAGRGRTERGRGRAVPGAAGVGPAGTTRRSAPPTSRESRTWSTCLTRVRDPTSPASRRRHTASESPFCKGPRTIASARLVRHCCGVQVKVAR